MSHSRLHVFAHVHALRVFFFFNDTATTEIYTLSLHDALPISRQSHHHRHCRSAARRVGAPGVRDSGPAARSRRVERSEEHTSELQSQSNLVCRLLLEKKKRRPAACWRKRACRATLWPPSRPPC